jgi:hypothetical protein
MSVAQSISYMDSTTSAKGGNLTFQFYLLFKFKMSNFVFFINASICFKYYRYNIKLWKLFGDCFNTLPILAIIDDKIICMHGGLSPDLNSID